FGERGAGPLAMAILAEITVVLSVGAVLMSTARSERAGTAALLVRGTVQTPVGVGILLGGALAAPGAAWPAPADDLPGLLGAGGPAHRAGHRRRRRRGGRREARRPPRARLVGAGSAAAPRAVLGAARRAAGRAADGGERLPRRAALPGRRRPGLRRGAGVDGGEHRDRSPRRRVGPPLKDPRADLVRDRAAVRPRRRGCRRPPAAPRAGRTCGRSRRAARGCRAGRPGGRCRRRAAGRSWARPRRCPTGRAARRPAPRAGGWPGRAPCRRPGRCSGRRGGRTRSGAPPPARTPGRVGGPRPAPAGSRTRARRARAAVRRSRP